MMIRHLAALLVLAPAAALAAPRTSIARVTSTPERALVTVVGFGECETPCRIEIDRPREIVVAKAGFIPQRLTIDRNRKRVHVTLELAAPTKGVDSESLPEL